MKLREMDEDEMFSQLEELSKLQLEEILPVLDNLREDDYDMKKYIDLAMEQTSPLAFSDEGTYLEQSKAVAIHLRLNTECIFFGHYIQKKGL